MAHDISNFALSYVKRTKNKLWIRVTQLLTLACKEQINAGRLSFEEGKQLIRQVKTVVYPEKFWQQVQDHMEMVSLDGPYKSIDFHFMGTVFASDNQQRHRSWLFTFPWTDHSLLVVTDPAGNRPDDYQSPIHPIADRTFQPEQTTELLRHVPRYARKHCNRFALAQFDRSYYVSMAKAHFVLCPGGDAPWSFRFTEAIMCHAIPVVSDPSHTRCPDSHVNEQLYKYYLYDPATQRFCPSTAEETYRLDPSQWTESHPVYHREWIPHNLTLFYQHHTLVPLDGLSFADRYWAAE